MADLILLAEDDDENTTMVRVLSTTTNPHPVIVDSVWAVSILNFRKFKSY